MNTIKYNLQKDILEATEGLTFESPTVDTFDELKKRIIEKCPHVDNVSIYVKDNNPGVWNTTMNIRVSSDIRVNVVKGKLVPGY